MARNKAPFPSIVHLKVLMELYTKMHQIPSYPDRISEKMFVEKLTSCLVKDKILEGKSKNLVDKLRGLPFQKREEDSEGIEIERIEKLSKKIFDFYHLENSIENFNGEFYWNAVQNLIPVPDYLKHINSEKYYKYLSYINKNLVDGFVERKVNELIDSSDDIHTYCMYYFNESNKQIEVGVLQLNKKEEKATVKYFYRDEKWITKSVQRTDKPGGLFRLSQSTFYINLVEEDDSKAHLRTNICLAVHDTDFYSLKVIKGTYSTSRQNVDMPVAGMLILEKRKSFPEAEKAAKDGVDPRITFDIWKQRISVNEPKILSFDDFASHKIFKVVERIAGSYYFGFFKNRAISKDPKPIITRGICFIEPSGRVTMQLAEAEIYQGFVDNDIYYNNDIVCITNFFGKSTDSFKYKYTLKLIKDKSDGYKVNELNGIYCGVNELEPRSGRIVFIRCKESFKNFDELKNSGIDYNRLHDLDKLKKSEEVELFNKLKESKYMIVE